MLYIDQTIRQQAAVDPGVLKLLPGFKAFAFRVTGLADVDRAKADLALREEAAAALRELDIEDLAAQPQIAAWRQAYKAMGLKSADYRSSIEQLVRRSLRGGLVTTGSWLIDLYNRASIAWLAPLGGYDEAAVKGARITIRPLSDADRFEPLGGGGERFPLTPKVVGYATGSEVLCWAVNHRDAARTALSSETQSAVFFGEAVDQEGARRVGRALNDLGNALADLGAEVGHVTTVHTEEAEVTHT